MAGRGDIKAGGAYVELSAKTGGLSKGLAFAKAGLIGAAQGFAVAAAAGVAAGIAIGGVCLKSFVDAGSALDDLSQRTGLSVEALSELQHAAEMSGTDMEAVEGAVRRMQKSLGGEITGDTAAALKELGLEAEALQAMSPEEQFTAIGAAIGDINDPTKRTAMAMKMFGKSGAELTPMLAEMEALRQEARDMGFVMSTSSAKGAAKLGDQLDTLWKTVKFVGHAVGELLGKVLSKVLEYVQPSLTAFLKWTQTIRDALLNGQFAVAAMIAFKGIQLAAMTALSGLAGLVGGALGDVIGSISSKLLSGDFAGAWNDVIAAMYEGWANFSQGVVQVFSDAADAVLSIWHSVEDQITDFILGNASEGGWLGKLAMTGSGVDFEKEIERSKSLNAKLRARGLGGDDKDPLAQAQADARAITAGRADKLREGLTAVTDAMKAAAAQTAEDAARRRQEQTGGGMTKAQETINRLTEEMAALRAQITPQEGGDANVAGEDKAEEVAGLQGKVAGTFSAAAALAMGGGGNPLSRLVGLTQKQIDYAERQLRMEERILKAVEGAGVLS